MRNVSSVFSDEWTYWRWEWGPEPELWRLLRTKRGSWSPEEYSPRGTWGHTGPSALDAITGMGADAYSSGEFAFEITPEEAAELAQMIRDHASS